MLAIQTLPFLDNSHVVYVSFMFFFHVCNAAHGYHSKIIQFKNSFQLIILILKDLKRNKISEALKQCLGQLMVK